MDEPGVVALGGGTVLRRANRALIRRAGRLVWLDTDRSSILSRLRRDRPSRPLYLDAHTAAQLLDERRPIYRDCDLAVRVAPGQSPAEVAAAILDRF